MEYSDDELIVKYREGDAASFDALVTRYLDPIYGFAKRMTGNQTDAEDIAQETFVKVWKTLPRYRTTGTFKSWIYAIARNTAIDRLRKKKIPVFSDYEDREGRNILTESVSDPDTLPEVLIEKAENKKLTEEALSRLPVVDREILVLHYADGLTFEAIGKILKKPLNTVKSRNRRAIAKLKEYFEKAP